MIELERMGRLDELRLFEKWHHDNPEKSLTEYVGYRASVLQELADPNQQTLLDDDAKLHATRAGLIDLLAITKEAGYANNSLTLFLTDMIMYRIQAIWNGAKIIENSNHE
jgi:hypothetical protein